MITVKAPSKLYNTKISVGGSKSISNRILIIKYLLDLNIDIQNISVSDDTIVLIHALSDIRFSNKLAINIHHAGTDMRFLTALLSVLPGERTLTGSERMKQRPIGELVKTLQRLGTEIEYLENENFPPLKIKGKTLQGGSMEIDSSVSSQFISALLLIAPTFKEGLNLTLNGNTVSLPYIHMTISLLQQFGVDVKMENNCITVKPFGCKERRNYQFRIESDWSSASYWYSMVALSANLQVELPDFFKNSLQADHALPLIYEKFGVTTVFYEDKIVLSKSAMQITEFEYDFTNCPDIAQTLAVTCLGVGIGCRLTGLQTLKLKETDRILALKNELEKFGVNCLATDSSIEFNSPTTSLPKNIVVATYNDHRMAMSFAPLCLKTKLIQIENENVVSKSYPHFWKDLEKVGFEVDAIESIPFS